LNFSPNITHGLRTKEVFDEEISAITPARRKGVRGGDGAGAETGAL